ncbi:hypothetical protein K2Q08_03710 [Patescibacteria group bacterium]|nr:hypothetical protein [Patescibacteria group bacterium]
MEQVKIFDDSAPEGEYKTDRTRLEEKLNAWLAEQGDGIEVTRVLQNSYQFSNLSLVITIFYKKKS